MIARFAWSENSYVLAAGMLQACVEILKIKNFLLYEIRRLFHFFHFLKFFQFPILFQYDNASCTILQCTN